MLGHSWVPLQRFVHTILTVTLTATPLVLFGCVSHDTYELAKKDAEHARMLYQTEQRHAQELILANKRMKQQIEETQTALRESQDNLARVERDWRETRDELLRIKIEREQRRGGRERAASLGVESSPVSPSAARPGPTTADGGRRPLSAEELKERLKTVLEQLQAVLQEF